jgi:FKBP-type peptidyl-prolyl cis-trans isomerase FkpA
MRVLCILLGAVTIAQLALPAPQAAGMKSTAVMTDDEKTVYALGLSIYRSLGQFDLSPAELAIVERAMSDAASGKPAIELNTWGPKIQPFARARAAQGLEREKAASQAYIEKAAIQPGAVKTDSGLIYRELRPGTGPSPASTDTVKVNYRGTLVNGTEFDSSYSRNEPAQFALNGVIPCWTEGLQKMKVGGKAELVCPSNLAYGDGGRPSIPGGAALIFEVELLEIAGANPPVPPAPPSPATPPAPPAPPSQ